MDNWFGFSFVVLLCSCVGDFACDVLMSLFVPHFPFFGCLGKVVLRDCGMASVSSRIAFVSLARQIHKCAHVTH